MTFSQFSLLFGVLMVGVMIGVFILALFVGSQDDTDDLVSQAANAQAALLLDFLNNSECNLFFNPAMGAWGLLDGQNKMLATARNVHTTLTRAMQSEQSEVPSDAN